MGHCEFSCGSINGGEGRTTLQVLSSGMFVPFFFQTHRLY